MAITNFPKAHLGRHRESRDVCEQFAALVAKQSMTVVRLTGCEGRSKSAAGGGSLADVRDAAGHSSIATTSVYTHVVGGDEEVGNLFDFAAPSE